MSTGIYPRLGTPLNSRTRSAGPSPSPAVGNPVSLGTNPNTPGKGKGVEGKYRLQRGSSTQPVSAYFTNEQPNLISLRFSLRRCRLARSGETNRNTAERAAEERTEDKGEFLVGAVRSCERGYRWIAASRARSREKIRNCINCFANESLSFLPTW